MVFEQINTVFCQQTDTLHIGTSRSRFFRFLEQSSTSKHRDDDFVFLAQSNTSNSLEHRDHDSILFFGAKQHIGASPFLLLEQRNIVEGASRSRFFLFFLNKQHIETFCFFGPKQQWSIAITILFFGAKQHTHTHTHIGASRS